MLELSNDKYHTDSESNHSVDWVSLEAIAPNQPEINPFPFDEICHRNAAGHLHCMEYLAQTISGFV
jgi:hypothetical protein